MATGAGIHTAVAGARSVPGYSGSADAQLESELRFYGVFYAAYGIALWHAASRAEPDAAQVRGLAAVLWAAGAARAGGWWRAGRPSTHQLGLLTLELTAPPLVLAWQSASPTRGRAPACSGERPERHVRHPAV